MTARPVKWRWALYGLAIGMAICVAALILEGTGYQFGSWLRPGIVRSAGFSATMLIFGTVGLVAGIMRDRMHSGHWL
jgi:Na+/H+ antiporter NhaD/arsenite permease-like protein